MTTLERAGNRCEDVWIWIPDKMTVVHQQLSWEVWTKGLPSLVKGTSFKNPNYVNTIILHNTCSKFMKTIMKYHKKQCSHGMRGKPSASGHRQHFEHTMTRFTKHHKDKLLFFCSSKDGNGQSGTQHNMLLSRKPMTSCQWELKWRVLLLEECCSGRNSEL